MGELDDRLKVVEKKKFKVKKKRDKDNYNREEGTKKRRRFYLKEDLPEMRCSSDGPFFLHSIKLRLVEPNQKFKYRLHDPELDAQSLGFLSSVSLPAVGPFTIFSPSGTIKAEVTPVKEVDLTDSQVEECMAFHRHIFSEVLGLTHLMDFLGGGIVVVPLREKEELDNILLTSFKGFERDLDLQQVEHLVVFPKYKKSRDRYFIEGLVEGLEVGDKMPGSSETFYNYYRRKYNIEVQDTGEPFLRISSADKRPKMLQPSVEIKREAKTGREAVEGATLFLPQLIGVEKVNAGMWRQAQMLPSILHRVVTFLRTKKLLVDLEMWKEDDMTEMDLVKTLSSLTSFELLTDSRLEKLPPQPWQVLEGITLAAAGDVVDMERLEVMGDSFLKFSTSVFVYCKSLELGEDEYSHKDEGEMTCERSEVVSNLHLFNLARNLDMQQAIVERTLEPLLAWQPPGFSRQHLDEYLVHLDTKFGPHVKDPEYRRTLTGGSLLNWLRTEDLPTILQRSEEEVLDLAMERMKAEECGGVSLRNYKLISDKSIADCMEAVIGAFLIHSGQRGALRAMAGMGINLAASATITQLLEGKPSFDHVTPFGHQRDAFRDDIVRGQTEK